MSDSITALIQNYNMNCYKQYTKVSNYLGNILDNSLKEIERFYYTEFWEDRLFDKLDYWYLSTSTKLNDICRIQGATSYLRDDIKFKLFDESANESGLSNSNMIALNINMKDINDSRINNIIMHEFGHRQYLLPEFQIIKDLNLISFGNIKEYVIDQSLSQEDIKYFTDDNELRQRIIPIIKEMYDNNWTATEAYELSENLRIDDIKTIFTREYIIYLLENIL